jgi:methionine-gamma-lyase
MNNFSGMITFQIDNAKTRVREIADRLQVIHYAVSLGHHRSLVFYLNTADLQQTTFKLATPSQRSSWDEFAGEGIFRLSVGLEDADDLIADLEQALRP